MAEMKTLANCKATEFAVQVNKIRHEIAGFYEAIGIKKLKEEAAALAAKATSKEETEAVRRKYLSDLLDSALEINAEATVAVIGLAAFKTREEALAMSSGEMLEIFSQLIGCKAVIDFFVNAGKSGLFDTAKS